MDTAGGIAIDSRQALVVYLISTYIALILGFQAAWMRKRRSRLVVLAIATSAEAFFATLVLNAGFLSAIPGFLDAGGAPRLLTLEFMLSVAALSLLPGVTMVFCLMVKRGRPSILLFIIELSLSFAFAVTMNLNNKIVASTPVLGYYVNNVGPTVFAASVAYFAAALMYLVLEMIKAMGEFSAAKR